VFEPPSPSDRFDVRHDVCSSAALQVVTAGNGTATQFVFRNELRPGLIRRPRIIPSPTRLGLRTRTANLAIVSISETDLRTSEFGVEEEAGLQCGIGQTSIAQKTRESSRRPQVTKERTENFIDTRSLFASDPSATSPGALTRSHDSGSTFGCVHGTRTKVQPSPLPRTVINALRPRIVPGSRASSFGILYGAWRQTWFRVITGRATQKKDWSDPAASPSLRAWLRGVKAIIDYIGRYYDDEEWSDDADDRIELKTKRLPRKRAPMSSIPPLLLSVTAWVTPSGLADHGQLHQPAKDQVGAPG
jgi:hypothetical protein